MWSSHFTKALGLTLLNQCRRRLYARRHAFKGEGCCDVCFEFDSFVYELKQINDLGGESLDCTQNRVGLVCNIQLVFDVGICMCD